MFNRIYLSQLPDNPVFYFIPNIIGYVRFVLLFCGMLILYSSVFSTFGMFLCFISFLLDFIDGRIARMLNQTSRFGMYLDMCVDRMFNGMYYNFIISIYPENTYQIFMWSIFSGLDFVSHFMIGILSLSRKQKSHKRMYNSIWLNRYYQNINYLMYILMFGELFYFQNQIIYKEETQSSSIENNNNYVFYHVFNIASFMYYYVCMVIYLAKQYVNYLQLSHACLTIAKNDFTPSNDKK